jgi:hypothetical protein
MNRTCSSFESGFHLTDIWGRGLPSLPIRGGLDSGDFLLGSGSSAAGCAGASRANAWARASFPAGVFFVGGGRAGRLAGAGARNMDMALSSPVFLPLLVLDLAEVTVLEDVD